MTGSGVLSHPPIKLLREILSLHIGPVIKTAVLGLALLFLQTPARAQWAVPQTASTIPAANLMQTGELVKLLQAPAASRPLIFQVGSRIMFAQAHIPGSEFTGPGSQAEGLDVLRSRVKALAKSRLIVLYCGCCPWNRCPNLAPAFNMLQGMGFTRVKALYIPDNFGADWVNKGFPVERGQ